MKELDIHFLAAQLETLTYVVENIRTYLEDFEDTPDPRQIPLPLHPVRTRSAASVRLHALAAERRGTVGSRRPA